MAPGPDGVFRPSLASFLTGPGAVAPGQTGQMFSNAVGNVLMPSVPYLPRMVDPIRLELEAELGRVFGGEVSNPGLSRAFTEEEAQLRNSLFQALGPGYELTTPGQAALQRLRESHGIRREEDRRQTLAAFLPQEASRREAEYAQPLRALDVLGSGEMARANFQEGVRQRGFGERLGLLGLGRESIPALSTTMGAYAPIPSLLGLESSAAAQQRYADLLHQSNLAAYNAQNQSNASLASGIGGIFGTAAGTFGPGLRLSVG